MYYSDKPISTEKEDLLNRSGFARILAKLLLNFNSDATFTVGLFGKWGCGKTSIVNMALQDMNELNGEAGSTTAPVIVNFEPWNFSNTDQLLAQFFIRLSNELRSNNDKKLAEVGDALTKYADAFELANALPVIGHAISLGGKTTFSLLGKKLKKGSDESDILKQKENVIKRLKEQPTKILVVLDDIDRLSNEQIRQVFQLITSVAKFPNTIYLLVFDKEVVVKALEKVQEGSGEEYLEKIIQVPISIPELQKSELNGVLFSQLDTILANHDEQRLDIARWQRIFELCVTPFVKTLRDVYRLCNILTFKLTAVSTEIDFSDMIAISALEIGHPIIYNWVIEHKGLMTGEFNLTSFKLSDKPKEQYLALYQSEIDDLLKKENSQTNTRDTAEILIESLSQLFPFFGHKVGKIFENVDMDRMRYNSNIGHPEKFDRYFNLNVECIDLKRATTRNAIFQMHADDFSTFLIEQDKKGTSYQFLEEIKAALPDIASNRARIIIMALLNTADRLDSVESKSLFSVSASNYATQLIQKLMNRLDADERYPFIGECVNTAVLSSLPQLAMFLNITELAFGRLAANGEEHTDKKLIAIEELEKLEISFREKAKELLEGNNVLVLKNWWMVLYLLEYFDQEYANHYIEKLLIRDENVLRYLEGSVNVWTGSGTEYEMRSDYEKYMTDERIIQSISSTKADASFFSLPKKIQDISGAFWLNTNNKATYNNHVAQRDVDKLLASWRAEAFTIV